MIGTSIGTYRITANLGAGGMGEVYRATDIKLKRDVALKVLPETFARDPERLARFEREAEVLASLNHPNIAAIYGVVEDRALVMELVEGSEPKGPLPLDEAWAIMSQVAAALEYAHEKGVVHRDLKPANIKVTQDGQVKLLDFGLAKAFSNQRERSPDAENSPTLTIQATEVGVILGTAAYMSPEQAKGKSVDKRADIWAFGVVLYELLTGERLFKGEDVSETLAQVLMKELDLNKVPAKIRKLVSSCLEKDPKQRLRDIGDAKRLLVEESPTPSAPPQSRLGWTAACVFAAATLVFGLVYLRHMREEASRLLKMSVLPPEKATFKSTSLPAVSPDGRRIAFVATFDGKDQLWVRDLDSLAARALTGTDGANYPFWSPDSRSIAFFADGKLKKIGGGGGPALTLCEAVAARGGNWSRNGIVFTVNRGGTFRVAPVGGIAIAITTPDLTLGESSHRYPWFLPDGHHFLYTANNQEEEKVAIYAGDLDSKSRKLILRVNSNAVYAPPGYLLFVREGTLMAQPFDAAKLQTTGDAVPVAEHVDFAGIAQSQFSVSQNGVLAYTSGAEGEGSQLTWVDRSGKVTGTLGARGDINRAMISPDGQTVAIDRASQQTKLYDIWLYDLQRGTVSRFTFGPSNNEFPVWSPDGSHIAFFSTRGGGGNPFQKATSGTAQDEMLSKPIGQPPSATRVEDWSRDGRYIVLTTTGNPKTSSDVWVLPTFGERKPFPYLQTEFNECCARLSPNGKWLAYRSDESKRNEIYVQSFPTPGGKWQISTNGGGRPAWSQDGKELYFVGLDGKMMAVEVKSGSKFEPGAPKPLFDSHIAPGNTWYDVSKDGRFLIPIEAEQNANTPMTVVVNWTAALTK